MPPCSSGSRAPQDPPVILHATSGTAVDAALPARSRFHGTRSLIQNECRARDAAVSRLVAEAAQAASVAHDLDSPELHSVRLHSARLEMKAKQLELEDAQAAEDARELTIWQRRLRDDAEMAVLDEEIAAQEDKIAELNQEKAAMAAAH